MRLCPECHQEVPDTAIICPHCGSPRLMDGMSDAEILRAHDPVKEYEARRRREMRLFFLLGGLCLATFAGVLVLGLLTRGTAALHDILFGGRRRLILLAPLSALMFYKGWDRFQEGREDYSKEP